MYLVVGGASILLAFGGSRFTAPIAEGYFGYVIKAGVRLLFFYLVLGIGVKIATGWNNALVAACAPATTTLPWFSGLGAGPPSSIITRVCSAPMNSAFASEPCCKQRHPRNRHDRSSFHRCRYRQRHSRTCAQPSF